jgi:CDP-paratose 2-epimerase
VSTLHHLRLGLKPVLITGGAGFLGANIADQLAGDGQPVLVYDSLERPGVERNLAWLKERHGERIAVAVADIRDADALDQMVRDVSAVFHLAAQVAVTTSLADPVVDFEVNARGTLNLLEALRRRADPPPLLFASTNKVYGKLHGAENLRRDDTRWQPTDGLAAHGCGENTPLDFYSPYGCSKGVADQYVLDYARVFGLPTLVLRMSCLYGPRQFGTEDQGWIAHFLIRALNGDPLTVFGDGRQVRDALFVDDAVAAWLAAWRGIDQLSGRAFNLGGGPENTLSLLELLERIPALTGRRPEVSYAPARPGDQLWYVSDTRALSEATDWRPRTGLEQGLERLVAWLAVHVAGEADRRREVPA